MKVIGKIPSQRRITMRRIIAIAFLAAVMGTAASSARAQATSTVTIPFAFHVGSTLMPAGIYYVQSMDADVFCLNNWDRHESAIALAATTSGSTAPAKKLVFNRYGERYFLSAILDDRGESQKTFARSKLERTIRDEEASLKDEEQVLLAVK
jgi:hypothetical protein